MKLQSRTVVLMASQPWSNISPSGPAMPVRRACLPSMASRDWYMKRPTAQLRAHAASEYGPCSLPVQLTS
jgi:hypothetical protein